MRILWVVATLVSASPAAAKGLETLSGQNPETKAAEEEAAADGDSATESVEGEAADESPAAATSGVKSAASKALADKLFVATSFGWVKATKSSGDYKGSGMSDLTVGYRVVNLNDAMAIAATYRYAPVAVSGREDGHLYRGVWEGHNVGGRFRYKTSPKIAAIGTAEAGYVSTRVTPVDGLPEGGKAEAGGGVFTLGGGADFALNLGAGEQTAFQAGPRLYLGFGSVSTVQLAASAGFAF